MTVCELYMRKTTAALECAAFFCFVLSAARERELERGLV